MTTSSPKSKQSPLKNSSPIKGEKDVASSPSAKQIKPPSTPTPTASIPAPIARPSAEDLVDLERELQKLIARKIQADTNLVKIESKLYDLETEYLTETQSFGNLIHGVEGYLGLPAAAIPANSLKRNAPFNNSTSSLSTMTSPSSAINPQQRLFSSTSTSFQKSLALIGRVPEAIANGYVPPSATETSSDLTSINGLRSSSKNHNGENNKKTATSPSKKSSSSSSNNKPTSTSTNSSAGVNKNKKTSTEAAEWQPPSMKSSRKK